MSTIFKNQFTELTLQFTDISPDNFWAVLTLIEDFNGEKDVAQVQIIGHRVDGVKYITTANVTQGATLARLANLMKVVPFLAKIMAEMLGIKEIPNSQDFQNQMIEKIDSAMQVKNFTKKFRGAVQAARFNPAEVQL